MSTDLKTLRDEAKAARLKRQIAEDTAIAETLAPSDLPGQPVWTPLGLEALQEAQGDWVDPRGWMTDDPRFGRSGGQTASMPGDRAGGRMLPIIESDTDLDQIRGISRRISYTSPSAKCALLNLTNWVIGTGFEYSIEPADKHNTDPALVAAVQRVLDEFDGENDWQGDFERELFQRKVRDGEYFVVLFGQGGGHVQLRAIEPELIRTPLDWPPMGQTYSFGIDTKEFDVQTVLGYWVDWTGEDDWEYLPAGRIEHVKRNVDRTVKRGLSDFYAVYEFLRDAEKLLRNTAKSAGIAAAIAWIEEFAPGTNQDQVESLRASTRTMKWNQTDMTGRQRTKYARHYEPGTIAQVEAGRKYHPSPLTMTNGANFVEIEQGVLRIVGSNWAMPEYMISGDASNANYSSTMVAESPFVKNGEQEQQFTVSKHRRLLWKVLDYAVQAGRLHKYNVYDVRQLQRLVQLAIEPPKVAATDASAEEGIRAIRHDKGVLSTETWQQEVNLDPEVEKERGAAPAVLPLPMMESRQTRFAHKLWEGYG